MRYIKSEQAMMWNHMPLITRGLSWQTRSVQIQRFMHTPKRDLGNTCKVLVIGVT